MAVSDWIAARGRDMAGRAKARTVRRPLKAWLLLAAVGVTLLVLLPVCYLVIRAVQGGQASLQALAAGSTVLTLARTVALGASVTLATIVLAVPLALLTERSDLPMPRLVTILLVLPLVIPSYIAAYLLVAFLGPQGMLADFLGQFTAVQQLPSIYGFPGAFILLTLLCLPYVYLPVRAALRGMDPDQEEAGRSLGRSSWTVFRRITLPQLWPAMPPARRWWACTCCVISERWRSCATIPSRACSTSSTGRLSTVIPARRWRWCWSPWR